MPSPDDLLEGAHYRCPEIAPDPMEPLHVIVVGAGMAGLGTALALRNFGHEVTVLEQAPAFGEVGQSFPSLTRSLSEANIK